MRRRIVNHHKLIKSIDRTAEKTERFFDRIFKNKNPRKLKDYNWKGTQYNPYRREDGSGKKRLLINLSVLGLTVIVLIYLVVFSGLFNITTITIVGNDRIKESDIKAVVTNTLEYKNFRLIPNSSFFVANTADIIEVLKGRFPIDQIKIEKKFPHDLHIEITEKISTIIYDNGIVYGLVGLDGGVIELIRAVENREWREATGKITTTTEEGTTTTIDSILGQEHTPDTTIVEDAGNYPLVYDKRSHQTDKGLLVLKPEEARLIIDWYNEIKDMDFGVVLFTIENDLDFHIKTSQGWEIKSRFARTNAPDQLKELKLALQKIENKKTLSYIDLRYENRIYWK